MPTPEQLNHPHPSIREFANKVHKRQALTGDANKFRKWVEGPKISDAEREVGRDLLAQFESLGEKAKSNVQGSTAGMQAAAPPRGHGRGFGGGGQEPPKARPNAAADPKVLGEPFHNPYTFIPFGEAPHRRTPTPLTIDEREPDRFTGVLELEIRTLSPLMTCKGTPEDPKAEHKTYRALTIGDDVIVPATGVRGSLRSLLTILAGGTLGYLDESIWLCQGRDVNLGSGTTRDDGTNFLPSLAQVIKSPEGRLRLRLGKTTMVKLDDLVRELPQIDGRRPVDERRRPEKLGERFVKLAGRMPTRRTQAAQGPAGRRNQYWEAIFEPVGEPVEIAPEVWHAYVGRHRHSPFGELKHLDLVWMQPKDPGIRSIERGDQVGGIQWARWGRSGKRLLDLVKTHHPDMLPDALNPDGRVDEVTDLFGQVPREDLAKLAFPDSQSSPAAAFAARVRPENLVFKGGRSHLDRDVALAPLAAPHPGCLAFYRDQDDLGGFSSGDPLRGYKVYRTTSERGDLAPWQWHTQPIFDRNGQPERPRHRMNKTVELLREGQVGTLRLACRGLTQQELSLLFAACGVDWRLGGGKPLGLGHCRVVSVRVCSECGKTSEWRLGEPDAAAIDRVAPSKVHVPLGIEVRSDPTASISESVLQQRCSVYQATQRPVPRLRYPRAAAGGQRGGHTWFGRRASPRKSREGQVVEGLEVLWIHGDLATQAGAGQIQPQPLPKFDPGSPFADVLFGFDIEFGDARRGGHNTSFGSARPIDPENYRRGPVRDGGMRNPNADDRRRQREARE